MRPATTILASALVALAASAPSAGADWTPARVLPPGLPEVPAVAVDARGNAVMAGTERAGVWVARLGRDGLPGRRQVVPGSGGRPQAPAVALSDDGALAVAWMAGASPVVTAASWRLGHAPVRGVAVSRPGWAGGPFALRAASGETALAWLEDQPGPPASMRSAVGSADLAPAARPRASLVTETTGQTLGDVAVGTDRAGRSAVTWTTRDPLMPVPATLLSASPASAGAPSASPLDGSALDELSVLTDPDGGQLAVWRELDPSGSARILAAERAATATSFGPVEVLASGRRLGELVAAEGRHGDVALAWIGLAGPVNEVFALRRAPGRPWGRVAVVSARGRSGEQVATAIDDRGHTLIAWGSVHGTIAVRAPRGGPFAQRRTLSRTRTRPCWAPQVVVGGGGDAVATFVCSGPRGSSAARGEVARDAPPAG